MKYQIHPNGTFDLRFSGGEILGAYPYINGKPIHPTAIFIGENVARYEVGSGFVELKFSMEDAHLCIDSAFEGLEDVHDFAPIGGAEMPGAGQMFKQGFGMGGPTGLVDASEWSEANHLSHGLMALKCNDWIFLHARDHRRFQNKYHITRRAGALGGAPKDMLFAGFITENVTANCLLPRLFLHEGAELYPGLRECARHIANVMDARRAARPEFHWCSWYYLYHTLDETLLGDYIEGFKQYKGEIPFRYLQVDAGYFPSCGDWLKPTADRFPGGMEKPSEMIRDAGYGAGIWIGPFMVGDESELFRKHPDWVLKYKDGSYVRPWKWYNEPKAWGYRDSDYFVLDTSHPEAMDYLRQVFTTLRGWGYTLYKTDFLLWSMVDSSEVVRFSPGKTSIEYYRDTLAMIRECIGEESAWLGCIAPFLPSIGFVDMMRIGGDVGAQWKENGFGPVNMIRELLGDSYFNHVYWTNDPDATMLRDFHIHLTSVEIESLALLQALSGGLVTTSDPIHLIAPDRLELLRFIVPDGVRDPILPRFEEKDGGILMLHELEQGWLVFFMNPSDKEMICPCEWAKWLGDENWFIRKRHGHEAALHPIDVPYVAVQPHGCCLFFASRGELAEEPKNLWSW